MTRLQRHYEVHFLAYELVFALAVTGIIIAILESMSGRGHVAQALNGIRQGVYIAIASIAGSLLGFIVTTVSIIMGFMSSPRLRLVRESQHHQTLYSVFFSAIRYLAVVTVLALVGLLIDRDNAPKVWATYVVLGATLVATARMYRCVWVLEKVIRIVVRNEPT